MTDVKQAKIGQGKYAVRGIAKLVSADVPCIWGEPRSGSDTCFMTLTVTEEVFGELRIAPPQKD
jgi:hypothetical protein